MQVLAFDTATRACSAALWRDGRVVAHEFAPMDRGHAEALVPMVERVLAAAGVGFDALDRLAVTVGPGAFTGLRIGLAAARGMALAAGLPVFGVTTLEAVVAGIDADERAGARALAVIDAKRADVYAQLFDRDLAPASPPRALLPEDLREILGQPGATGAAGPLLVVGDGAGRVMEALDRAGFAASASTASGWPDAARVAAIAAAADPNGRPAEPLYLRPPQATRPARGGRLRP